jgi:hypothetical protein
MQAVSRIKSIRGLIEFVKSITLEVHARLVMQRLSGANGGSGGSAPCAKLRRPKELSTSPGEAWREFSSWWKELPPCHPLQAD